jgi:thymidylate kinase
VWRAIVRRPLRQLRRWGSFLWGHLRQQLEGQEGFFLVLLGPDGSGKTTIADSLGRSFPSCVFTRTLRYHGRFGVIPELKMFRHAGHRLLGRMSARASAVTDVPLPPGRAFHPWTAMVYVLYYTVDYLLGHLVVWWAKGRGYLIVFDRYFYDYFFQPTFARLPGRLLRAVAAIIPQPDVVVTLYADPARIHSRKPELSLPEIGRQQRALNGVVPRLSNARVVVAEGDSAGTVAEVERIIFSVLAGRT